MSNTSLQSCGQENLQSAVNTKPPIDSEILLARCMGNVSFALALIEELESNGKEQADSIVRHAASGDRAAVADAAHSMKGAAAIMGAERLRDKAAEIEATGRTCEPTILLDHVRKFQSEMARCLASIPKIQSEMQRPKPMPRQLNKLASADNGHACC